MSPIFAWYDRWSGAFWDRAQAEMLEAIETTAVKNNPQETPMTDQKPNRPDGDGLLPCPFCGEPAIFERPGNARQSCIIKCENCGCKLETGEVFQQGTAWNTRASPSPTRDGAEGAGDDPTSSAQWNEGCDFAMMQLCAFLGIDPHMVSWDAATETVDGDVRAVIGNILHAKFGEDWSPAAPPKAPPDALRESLKITICGSARFADEIDLANRRLSMQGHIVYSIIPLVSAVTAEQKEKLRAIHRAKIDASDAIYVVAIGGYIGSDVAAEIEYAKAADKVVLDIDEYGDAAAYGTVLSAPVPPADGTGDRRYCPNGLEHGSCLHPDCVSSCPGRLKLSLSPAVAAEPVLEMIRTLRNPGPKAREFSEFFDKVANTLERLAAPHSGSEGGR